MDKLKSLAIGNKINSNNAKMKRKSTKQIIGMSIFVYILAFIVVMAVLISKNEYIAIKNELDNSLLYFLRNFDFNFSFNSYLTSTIVHQLFIASIVSILPTVAFTYFKVKKAIEKGAKYANDNIISGTRLAKDIAETNKIVKKSQLGASDIKLCDSLYMPYLSERQGIFIHGSTGTGKTQLLMKLLDEISRVGDPVIIYDKESTLKTYYFDEDTDVELNPISSLCANWDMWEDARTPMELSSVAKFLIPESQGSSNPFWVDSARSVFTSLAWEMRNDKDRSIIKLLKSLITIPTEELSNMLSNTETAMLVDRDNKVTSNTIRMVIATYTKSLKFMVGLNEDKNKPPFSINKWVHQQSNSIEKFKSWLWITSRTTIHEDIRPLITMWLGMALKAIQSLQMNDNKRVWVIMDEATSLNKLQSLSGVVADIRKMGGCIVLGVQTYHQLKLIYGHDEATAITENLNTTAYFRSNKPDPAEWVSRDLGEHRLIKTKEIAGESSNSHNPEEMTRRTVYSGSIQTLPNLTCYIRFAGEYPITRKKIKFIAREVKCKSLIERDIDYDALKNIDAGISSILNSTNVSKECVADLRATAKVYREAEKEELMKGENQVEIKPEHNKVEWVE